MSKIVFIQRQLSFAQDAHKDPEVADYFNQAFKALGPYFAQRSRTVATGLTHAEQRILMPFLHGVEADDKTFRKATETYFDEILTKVPASGLKLEIGLEDDTQPLSADNLPKNIQDFVTWRHALGHPNLALNKQEADRNPTKHMYLHDPAEVSFNELKLNKLEDDALACYFKYKDDAVKVDQILTLSGINLTGLPTLAERVVQFKNLATKTDNKNEVEQKQALEKFITLCNDPDLLVKYLIQEMISAQVLERAGTTIFIKESGENIGANVKEAVAFLKDARNTRVYNLLRAQYENLVKKGSKLPELIINEVPAEVDTPAPTGRGRSKPVVD